VEVTFLAYVLNVKERFVMCIIPHKCGFHMYETIAVCDGRPHQALLRLRVHGAAQAKRRDTFQVSTGSSAVCS
jgi:hypothetical protein